MALQTTNWQMMAKVQKQRKGNDRNSRFMDQARRYLAMEDSFITTDTLPLHEKMTDDICGFLTKLHPNMAETIRLEHDLQMSKLRLQLQINQALATNRIARRQSRPPKPRRSQVRAGAHRMKPARRQPAGWLPERLQPVAKSGLSAAAAAPYPPPQTALNKP